MNSTHWIVFIFCIGLDEERIDPYSTRTSSIQCFGIGRVPEYHLGAVLYHKQLKKWHVPQSTPNLIMSLLRGSILPDELIEE
eukprot:scaffold2992_cov214-Amphora_coffeaeformis.AAC.33